MGDKTLHNIKIFHSTITNQHTIMSDGVVGLVLIDRLHQLMKYSTNTNHKSPVSEYLIK